MAQPLFNQGWYRYARQVPSPNVDDRPAGIAVDLLVIHSISLPPGVYGGGQIAEFFQNRLDFDTHPYFDGLRALRVSSHFLIGRTGALTQFASTEQRAWHAGLSSFEGRERCNDFSIGIELEGLEGEPFEPAQYDTLLSVGAALAQAHPLRAVASHRYIAPSRKADPGAAFDWPVVQRAWPGLRCHA